MSTQHTGDESQIEESSSADHYEEVPLGTMERSLPAPNHFSIDAADLYSKWKHWIKAFELYAIATDLTKKDDTIQWATLLHCLGLEVQRIFTTLPSENTKFNYVKQALENYFAPKRNVISERYKFRSRKQKPAVLQCLAERPL